jgi:dihydroorotate dehydrogenase
MSYALARKWLFRLDPETAHEYAVEYMERLQSIPVALRAIAAALRPPAGLEKTVLGLKFATPFGIAAGFDKNAALLPMLTALGFGFIEVGTVTLHAQHGNPQPRLFRYPEHKAVINRMGFNNEGAEAMAERIRRWRDGGGEQPPLLVNVGKNREVPIDEAHEAYAACYAIAAREADAAVLNLSSPNTPSLRDLQRPEHLERLLRTIASVRHGRQPVLIKIAPDLDESQVREISDVCVRMADGMICTNTTLDRLPGMNEAGGLSGRPLFEKSTRILALVRSVVGQGYPLIGVGGVFTAADVRAKLAAGADLVQTYTGFIYEGPLMAARIAKGLAKHA